MTDAEQTKHIEFAQGYAALKMYGDALAELACVLQARPEQKDALYLQGIVLLEQNRIAEAEAPLRRLSELDPEQAHVFVHLAYIYRRTVSLERAVETIGRALELKPAMPIALYNLACYRAVQGQEKESLRLLAQAVQLSKEYRELARKDPDFDSLRTNAEFVALVKTAGT